MSNKFLVVDDTILVKKVVKRSIEGLGYDLLEASDGLEGLAVLKKDYPSIKLILLDWNMPKMNGYDFLKTVKSSKTLKHIPVIMLTTESEKSNINKALQEGAAGYVLKPFNKEELVGNIMKVLANEK